MTMTTGGATGVGPLVRRWRERRRRSQLDVSIAADVSTRHLSCIETGRSRPSRDMIERLCDELDVPLRERNAFHLAAGLAPVHRERPLADLGAAREAIDAVLAGQNPNPAVAVDSRWDLLAANAAMRRFLADTPESLTGPPLNMLRVSLHPDGFAGRLRNPAQWRRHVLRRVRRQWERTDDPALADLLEELESYPAPPPGGDVRAVGDDIAVPMILGTEFGDLSLLYAVTVFGSPRDVTLDEIAIETFFPADDTTRRILVAAAAG
ncbi:XRE family transcriptional regulator [Occultella glacieicola]|uniref:XRE family transcriptional regulator n=1 Tax=Occultella glacieicola TaxID=2518684 RepID=A0ABY2E2P4_9MICO|nr:helix-turn-helix transcriptional regulator [Occultella glacieicola]TDE93899.1 XRE family transcriptional regulator [Occultella glacieicola]